MISQLRGILIFKSPTEIIVECGGVGFSANVSLNTSSAMPVEGKEVTIFTILVPREDAIQLYGFRENSERDTFKMLTSIPGIGPKIALGILSSITAQELQHYILTNNITALQKLPGIGKKTAERLNLELKDKISKIDIKSDKLFPGMVSNLIKQEAVAALIALGYSSVIAEKTVKRALAEETAQDMTAEQVIRRALKYAVS